MAIDRVTYGICQIGIVFVENRVRFGVDDVGIFGLEWIAVSGLLRPRQIGIWTAARESVVAHSQDDVLAVDYAASDLERTRLARE